MFKEDYDNPELLLETLQELGVDNWSGYAEAKALYEQRKEEDIERVNKRVAKINDILMEADTPTKVTSLVLGIIGLVTDPNIFVAKMLNTLDDASLDFLHADICKTKVKKDTDE